MSEETIENPLTGEELSKKSLMIPFPEQEFMAEKCLPKKGMVICGGRREGKSSGVIEDICQAIQKMEQNDEAERFSLFGSQDQIDVWKQHFGDTVDYIVSEKIGENNE